MLILRVQTRTNRGQGFGKKKCSVSLSQGLLLVRRYNSYLGGKLLQYYNVLLIRNGSLVSICKCSVFSFKYLKYYIILNV